MNRLKAKVARATFSFWSRAGVDADHFLFLHIPKTAGTAMRRDIEAVTPEARYRFLPPRRYLQTFDDIASAPMEERARIAVVYGHMRFGLHEYLPGRSTYVTFLRDPVDRVVSLYFYIRQTASHPLHSVVSKMSLRSFVEEPITVEASNCHVRMLAGDPELFWTGEGGIPCEARHLSAAEHNLSTHFCHVGLQQRFRQDHDALRARLRWPLPSLRQGVVNASNRPPVSGLDEETVEAIRRANQYDITLFDRFKERSSSGEAVTLPQRGCRASGDDRAVGRPRR